MFSVFDVWEENYCERVCISEEFVGVLYVEFLEV